MPSHQGALDGLCGPYAVVNAFQLCGMSDGASIFETACGSLPAKRWPAVLWQGTTFRDVKRMIRYCQEAVPGTDAIRTRYPFERNPPTTPQQYWDEFDDLFENAPSIRCMIVGLTRPSLHWIVASRDTHKRVVFTDTDPHKPFQRKNRSSLHPGSRNGNPSKWIIDRSELILFEAD